MLIITVPLFSYIYGSHLTIKVVLHSEKKVDECLHNASLIYLIFLWVHFMFYVNTFANLIFTVVPILHLREVAIIVLAEDQNSKPNTLKTKASTLCMQACRVIAKEEALSRGRVLKQFSNSGQVASVYQ